MIVRTPQAALAATLLAAAALLAPVPSAAQAGAAPASAATQAGEPAVARRATELREAPAATARSLAALPEGSALQRSEERQGPWVRVRTAAGAAGWVHMFDLGPASGAGSGSGGGLADTAAGALRGVASLFGKPAPTRVTTPTSTIGIRGLGAEDLAQAQPDTAAVARLDALRASEQQARAFARDAALAPVAVEPLPAPQRAAPAGAGSGPEGQQ